MKKLLCIVLALFVFLSFASCTDDKTSENKAPIEINMPTDNTVNGYKNSSKNAQYNQINTDKITYTEITQTHSYWGNKNSKKFHTADCSTTNKTKDKNKTYKTRDQFISQGYTPCKICNP